MRCRFAFSQTSDGRLLITMEALWGFSAGLNGRFCVSAVDDENTFIQHVVLANLAKEETIELIAGVLLVFSGRPPSDRWVSAEVTDAQLAALGMKMDTEEKSAAAGQPASHWSGFVEREELARVFMEAPIPVCMMTGPGHTFTFINPAFVHMVGRASAVDILGFPIREALEELEGQPFFGLLDSVFKTGEPFVGMEMPAKLYHQESAAFQESYFDFVFHPVRDRKGDVCGILCQAADVTERVLEKHVRESREEQLYRQWAELDAIYRDSAVGMCLVDAKTMKLLRLNKQKAQLLGGRVEDLVGQTITELARDLPHVVQTYKEVIASKQGSTFEVVSDKRSDAGQQRTFLWNMKPVLDSTGAVESVASIVMEVTEWPRPYKDLMQAIYAS